MAHGRCASCRSSGRASCCSRPTSTCRRRPSARTSSLVSGLWRRSWKRLSCISWPRSSQNLKKMMPSRTICFSKRGVSSRKCWCCSGVQKPMTGSTPARLYQERSKVTNSPAVGKCVDVALVVPLAALGLGRLGQRHVARGSGVHVFAQRLDRAALAGRVAPLEHAACARLPLACIQASILTSSICSRSSVSSYSLMSSFLL